MNARPDPLAFNGDFNAQPKPASGISRLVPHLRGLAAGSMLAGVAFLLAQRELPESWRPTVILGVSAGEGERAEILAKQDAKVAFDRALADAQAQAQAKATADLAAIQAALQARTESLQPLSTLSGVADLLCVGGRAFASLGSANTGADWHNGATALAQGTCGAGNAIRETVTESQLAVVREVAAARGAPMNNGAVAADASPAEIVPHSLGEVYAISHAPRQYGDAEIMGARRAFADLPAWVQRPLLAGLTDSVDGVQAFVARMRAYEAYTHNAG